MIISASRRTDIPAFYANWFVNHIVNGIPFKVRNNDILVNDTITDCIVFWTKNPEPLMNRLSEINIPFYFQFTLNAYGQDIEPMVPNKSNIMIGTMEKLSDIIGSNKIVWRYDPIMITPKYTIEYHIKYFEELAKRFYDKCRSCTFSFVDMYGKCIPKIQAIGGREPSSEEMDLIAKRFSEIGKAYGITLQTCAELKNFEQYGITHGACIDANIINEITGKQIANEKDTTQRWACHCIPSVDIGQYYTCKHGCVYCYAS